MFFAFLASRVCVASTCSTSLVPMPCASAPKAPCVLVCESPHTTVMPGSVAPCSGPMTCTMPWRLSRNGKYAAAPKALMLSSSVVDLQLADRVADAVVPVGPAGRRRVVVGRGHDGADAPHRPIGQAQPLEGLRAGDFVHQVAVDIEHRGAVFLGVDDMLVPQFVVERSRGHGFTFQPPIVACHAGAVSGRRGQRRPGLHRDARHDDPG